MIVELSDELLERKIQLSEELLRVADILEPGLSRFRGCLLFELHEVLVIQAKRNYAKMAISKEQANVSNVPTLITRDICNVLKTNLFISSGVYFKFSAFSVTLVHLHKLTQCTFSWNNSFKTITDICELKL